MPERPKREGYGCGKERKRDCVCTRVGFILFIQICNLTHRLLDWKGVQPSLCPIGLDWIGCMQKRVLLSWFLIVVVVVHCPELRGVFYLSTLSSSLPHRAACFSFSISPTEIRVTLPLYFSTLSLCLRSLRRFLSSFFFPFPLSPLCSLLFLLLPFLPLFNCTPLLIPILQFFTPCPITSSLLFTTSFFNSFLHFHFVFLIALLPSLSLSLHFPSFFTFEPLRF